LEIRRSPAAAPTGWLTPRTVEVARRLHTPRSKRQLAQRLKHQVQPEPQAAPGQRAGAVRWVAPAPVQATTAQRLGPVLLLALPGGPPAASCRFALGPAGPRPSISRAASRLGASPLTARSCSPRGRAAPSTQRPPQRASGGGPRSPVSPRAASSHSTSCARIASAGEAVWLLPTQALPGASE